MRVMLALILTTLTLSGCANQGLRDLRNNSGGPDEFLVEPKAPLQAPQNFTELPPPTPGQANLTDKYPLAEAVVAVGGRPQASGGGVPASDGAIVTAASRFGVTQDIRGTLASSDEQFRKRKARFTQYRIVPVDRYNQAYRRQALDAHHVAGRWRNAGARTPSYPPRN